MKFKGRCFRKKQTDFKHFPNVAKNLCLAWKDPAYSLAFESLRTKQMKTSKLKCSKQTKDTAVESTVKGSLVKLRHKYFFSNRVKMLSRKSDFLTPVDSSF